MNILVTGAKGFVGKNLVANLYNIKDGKNQTRSFYIENIYEYDKDSIDKGREVPVKVDDHCMDAVRYLVMGMWSKIKHHLPIKEKEEEPEGVIK